jgi:peptidoglycan endopeptidase LytE
MLSQEQKEKIKTLALHLIGTPYIYGTSPEKAPQEFDCSSFIQYIYKNIGITLPRSSILQAADAQAAEIPVNVDYSNLETGDVLFMRGEGGHYKDSLFPGRDVYIGHTVLYIGDGQVVHARESIGKVEAQSLKELVALPRMNIVLAKRY